jgi:Tol biopolymer transport system component
MRSSILLVALFAAGCDCSHGGPGGTGGGSGGGSGGGPAPKSIAVTPADATYTTDGVTPATASYTAVATYADGHTEDVTMRAAFSLDDMGLGQFTGNSFKSVTNRGGRGTVSAMFNGATGTTSLTLVYQRTLNDPASTGLPMDVATRFGGTADSSRAPDLVYPNDGVLLPPNLGKLEIHFLPGANNTIFELSISSTYTNVKIYLQCTTPLNGGCIYLPDGAAWSAIATANRGTDAIAISLKGTDTNAGSTVGASSAIHIGFANDDIQGGLYYWTTTTKAIMRWDFASTIQTTPDKVVDAATVGGGVDCIGCHSLSPDGSKMVVEAEGSTDGRITVFNVANLSQQVAFPSPNKSFFESWNSDSTQFVGVDDRDTDFNLRIFDGATGALVTSISGTGDSAHATDHPSWAADGQTIAYAHVERNGPRAVSLQWPTHGAISAVTKTASGWGTAFDIAPAVDGKNRYYPAIAPSSDFVVYDESTCTGGGNADLDCDGDTDKSATLFAAKLQQSATLIPLTKANAPGKRDNGNTLLTNSFPKWSPFNFQRSRELGTKLQWLTFSSSRAYGLREPGTVGVWLWMVAIDPDQIAMGQDPSYAAFCLPFQDLTTSNHIPQWTQVVVPIIQ